jgi:hypothetical protein
MLDWHCPPLQTLFQTAPSKCLCALRPRFPIHVDAPQEAAHELTARRQPMSCDVFAVGCTRGSLR